MGLDSFFYGLAYRFGKPRWDTDQPRPELAELTKLRPVGRALDLGCGTGTNDVFLASRGWKVVGVDFVPEAIRAAREKAAHAGVAAEFVVGDVSRLRALGVTGPFDLVLDIGCFHAIPVERRDSYAAEVTAVTGKGADFYLAGIVDPPATWRILGARGVSSEELRRRFGANFEIEEERRDRHGFVVYHLVRTNGSEEGMMSQLRSAEA